MGYPQGGGLTPERQAFRERIRLEAAERFAAGSSNAEVAKDLRVSVRSVQRWRRAWHGIGAEGLRSAGPVSRPKLSDGWLGPQHRDVRQAVPAQCDRQGYVHEGLARIVDGPRFAPGSQSLGHDLVKAGLADRFDEQDRPGLGDDLAAVVLDADTGVGPDRVLHLESASAFSRNKDLDNPHSCWSEALSAFLTACRTARFMKARG
ncbi:hypothetical protein SVIO_025180 [Streptomyces violaceusniger]|uniref:Transposase n=1 Tax=Streptomyces violaceusniger TaxID=68280 RepID=A0A4D4KSJ2_STRVO|nr:hypothetical protein SVIO_025180 [Streptomyces violaceusniger]